MSAHTKPRYQQLKEQIVGRISDGELKPGDRVPSEHELVDSAGVSRMTANRALRELNDEGYVERIAGVGTFVAELKAASHLVEVRNIADEIERRGHRHSATVLMQRKEDASIESADALQVEPGSALFHLVLVHCENGVPIQQEDRYVLAEFAPQTLDQDFATLTPSAYLSSISPLQEAEHVVRACMPAAKVRRDLDMDDDMPCLLVIRRTWAHGRPVSYGRLYHPGDRYELTGHFVPPGTPTSNTDNIISLGQTNR